MATSFDRSLRIAARNQRHSSIFRIGSQCRVNEPRAQPEATPRRVANIQAMQKFR